MSKLYYTPPKQELFDEVKQKAKEVWFEGYDDQRYLEEKVGRIDGLQNVGDNFMYIVAMFDIHNQGRLAVKLSEETRNAVRERMIDGGNPPEYIRF